MGDPTVAGSMGDVQSLNRYAYSRNDPINAKDPKGLRMCSGFLFTLEIYSGAILVFSVSWFRPTSCDLDEGGGLGAGTGTREPDLRELWERWKNATPCERRTAVKYPFAAFEILELREQADTWFAEATRGMPPEEVDNTYENAVQHCYFSCLATIHLDLPIAKAFGDAHECNSEGVPENTDGSRHDLHNNDVGRTIGYNQGYDTSDNKCLKKCKASNDLRWIKGNPLP